MKHAWHRYTDNDRALALAALAANGGNLKRTARQLRIPRRTLQHWNNGECHPEVTNLAHQKRGELADALEAAVRKLLDGMTAKIPGANLLQLAVALGIYIDKMLLLQGRAGRVH